jgi:hypothetical protein
MGISPQVRVGVAPPTIRLAPRLAVGNVGQVEVAKIVAMGQVHSIGRVNRTHVRRHAYTSDRTATAWVQLERDRPGRDCSAPSGTRAKRHGNSWRRCTCLGGCLAVAQRNVRSCSILDLALARGVRGYRLLRTRATGSSDDQKNAQPVTLH